MKEFHYMSRTIVSLMAMLASVSIWTSPLYAPVEFGNGGDIVTCSQSTSSAFFGSYVLDYLVTYDFRTNNSDIEGYSGSHLTRIRQQLAAKIPEMASSLESFLSAYFEQVGREPDFSQQRIWKSLALGMVPLHDERIIEKLPANCYDGSTEQINLTQTVIRESRPNSVIYNYDPNAFALISSRPLQGSFLLIHEWLWDYTGDARVVRDANRLLQSDSVQNLNATDLRAQLISIGLQLSGPNRPVNEISVSITMPPGFAYSINPNSEIVVGAERTLITVDNASSTSFWIIPLSYQNHQPTAPATLLGPAGSQSSKISFWAPTNLPAFLNFRDSGGMETWVLVRH